MEFDNSTIAVSSEYFITIVFSVPVQSFVCNVKRTGDKTHPCGTPVEMDRSLDNSPLKRTNYFLWLKKFIFQMTNFGLMLGLASFLAKLYGFIVLNAEEKSANRIRTFTLFVWRKVLRRRVKIASSMLLFGLHAS